MSDRGKSIEVWTPGGRDSVPNNIDSPAELVTYARATLTPRDIQSIKVGFDAEGYEMVSTFVWTKASAALKKQLANLGMEFIGEMLGRPDITDDSDPTTAIADYEVIALAEDLGMLTATQAMRLKHSYQLVSHFASMQNPVDCDESMQKEEAVSLLKTCVSSILCEPSLDVAMKYADFRMRLTECTLQETDEDVKTIVAAPYFFIRTTLSVLLSMIKIEKGATVEHVVGNTMLLVPILWDKLRSNEKWQIGQAYAEANAAGRRAAAAGLKRALIDVQGFDFVPETLRSNTYSDAASKVLSAHFSFNNFYNEASPMKILANLGTTIPMPAFPKCMEATLACFLGNNWGHSFDAEDYAVQILSSLRSSQWSYYIEECLPRDRTILDKLVSEDKPIGRWHFVVFNNIGSEFIPRKIEVRRLYDASREGNASNIKRFARELRQQLGR